MGLPQAQIRVPLDSLEALRFFSSSPTSSSLPFHCLLLSWASQVVLVVKNPPANAGGDGLIPGSGRSPGGGNGNPLQYSCLENPVDRGAWWATVHGVAETWTWLSSSSLLASTGCAHVKQTLTLLPPVVISFFLLLNLANFWNKQSTSVVFSFSRALLMLWNYPLLHPSHFATWSSSLVFTFYTKLFAS